MLYHWYHQKGDAMFDLTRAAGDPLHNKRHSEQEEEEKKKEKQECKLALWAAFTSKRT